MSTWCRWSESLLRTLRGVAGDHGAGGDAGDGVPGEVWKALRGIPYGTTTSYGELARSLGVPGAMRAVGRANGQNRMSIVIPCHRVIGADGSLTGYGGGQPRKAFLLELEGGRGQVAELQGALFAEA